MAFQREPWLVGSQTPDACAAPAVHGAQQGGVLSPGRLSQKLSAGYREAKLPPLGKWGSLQVPSRLGIGSAGTNHLCNWQ